MKKERRPSPQTKNPYVYNHQRYPIPLPPVTNMDDIQSMLDDDLSSHSHRLYEDIRVVLNESRSLDVKPWEVELAYVKREQLLRRARHEAHEKWLSQQQAPYGHAPAVTKAPN